MNGDQNPRIKIEPERVKTDGEDAEILMKEYGYTLYEWQREIINCWLGTDNSGNYTATSAGLSVPRQNGKNICVEVREFYGLLINGEKIMHTAHQVKTAKRSFKRLVALFTDDRHPEIEDMVSAIRYTNGEESIELKNGGMIEYSARSRQSNRGFDGISLIVFDEAQELTDDQLDAIMALLSASTTGIRQLVYIGTPVYPGCPGTVFKRRREMMLKDPGPHDAWHEWSVCADRVENINVDDKKLWYQCNPSLGYRLTEEFTQEECRTMSPDGFARERLGWWAPQILGEKDLAFDEDKWKACKSDEKKPEGKTAYGVKFSVDGSDVCLCGAVIPKDGKARISIIERKSTSNGTRWLSDWLNERYKKASRVVIDGKNGVDLLIDRVSEVWRLKGSVVRASSSDVIAAASMLVDAVNEKTVTWFSGQPALSESALSSTKRAIGSGWGFGGEDSVPIEAAALALWGAFTSKRDPSKKMRIG